MKNAKHLTVHLLVLEAETPRFLGVFNSGDAQNIIRTLSMFGQTVSSVDTMDVQPGVRFVDVKMKSQPHARDFCFLPDYDPSRQVHWSAPRFHPLDGRRVRCQIDRGMPSSLSNLCSW